MACVRKWRNNWVIDYRDAEGTRRIITVGSKDEGNQKLADISQALKQGTYDPGKAKQKIKDYAVEWLESRRPEVKPSTSANYEYALRVHILPALGNFEIGKLTRPAVRRFLGRKAEQKKQNGTATISKDTVRIIKAALHAMLETAVEDGIVPTNVAHFKKGRRIVATGQSKGEKQARIRAKVFTREQLFLLLQAAREHADSYVALFFLLARTGLRIGEAIAVQIGDIDFVDRLLSVQRNIVRGKVGTPKDGVTRQVDMSTQLVKVLGQIVLDRKEQLLRLGMSADLLPTMWLFQNEVGKPMDSSKVRKAFSRILSKAGLSHRGLHWLRHTFASLLLQQGESLAYVKEQMGHSSIQITVDTYGHLVPGGNRQAVDRLDDDGNNLETFAKLEEEEQMQLIEKFGATRRSRTGDLLITNPIRKNTQGRK